MNSYSNPVACLIFSTNGEYISSYITHFLTSSCNLSSFIKVGSLILLVISFLENSSSPTLYVEILFGVVFVTATAGRTLFAGFEGDEDPRGGYLASQRIW